MEILWEGHKDVAIVSFPKSGRTWLRLMLGRLLSQHTGYLANNLFDLSPYNIHITHDDNPHEKQFNKICFDHTFRNYRVIFLVRNPKDILVSLYFQKTKREFQKLDDINFFVRSAIKGLIKFYNVWAAHRDIPKDFLLISYESLNQLNTLRNISNFIGLKSSDYELVDAMEFADFGKMRKYEIEGFLEDDIWGCKVLTPTDPNDMESYKTRRGKVGGYVDYLEKDSCIFLNKFINLELDDYYAIFKLKTFL